MEVPHSAVDGHLGPCETTTTAAPTTSTTSTNSTSTTTPACLPNDGTCSSDSQCCSEICDQNRCASCRSNLGRCTTNEQCCVGTCGRCCRGIGSPCTSASQCCRAAPAPVAPALAHRLTATVSKTVTAVAASAAAPSFASPSKQPACGRAVGEGWALYSAGTRPFLMPVFTDRVLVQNLGFWFKWGF